MGKINRLDEHLSNMIAAGEVVERPMGIVKELVENCMDAQAKHIEIQILQGGIDTITIIDDGVGMDQEDAQIAFERHATSKLKEINDLWNIHTMGFRGEALPSIASVSNVVLRTNNGEESTEVEINYGELKDVKPCGTPKGTMIQVKNLFQKTPARFKHLKSPQYEFSLISDVVQKFALSHPEIGFTLSHDGKQIFQTRGNGKLLEVLMQIYGRETAKTAISLDGKDLDYHITGYIMQPNFNRATKYYMLLYINGRMIRNYHLQKSVIDAYAPYMPKDRFPIVVINIEMDAQLVDVNVHPSKWEIRLSKEKQLEKLIYQTITEALRYDLEVPTINIKKEKQPKVELQEMQFTYERDQSVKELHDEVNHSFVKPQQSNIEEALVKSIENKQSNHTNYIEKTPVIEMKEKESVYKTEELIQPQKKENDFSVQSMQEEKENYSKIMENKIKEKEVVNNNISDEKETMESNEDIQKNTITKDLQEEPNNLQITNEEEHEKPKNPSLPQLRVIGQLHNCYIIAEGDKGLYIIDQHAAQERYHYEVIRDKILAGKNDTQPLLIPLTIETTVSAVTQLKELNQAMKYIGIQLESFGETTLLCRELPSWMQEIEEKEFIQDMIDVWEKDKEISLEKFRKHAIATMACHSSIRFNRNLTLEEMKRVIEDLGKCEQPFHCPHGRPTLICIEDKDLIHDFERG